MCTFGQGTIPGARVEDQVDRILTGRQVRAPVPPGDDAQTQGLGVEGERPVEIAHGERDVADALEHRLGPPEFHPSWRQVPLDDDRHVFGRHAGVPDVVRVDEDHRPFVVAARAGVAQHRGRRQPAPLDLSAEGLEELAAALRAAASLARRGANEDLSELCHAVNSISRRG